MDLQEAINQLQQINQQLAGSVKSLKETLAKSEQDELRAEAANQARQAKIDEDMRQAVQKMDEETIKLIGDFQLEE